MYILNIKFLKKCLVVCECPNCKFNSFLIVVESNLKNLPLNEILRKFKCFILYENKFKYFSFNLWNLKKFKKFKEKLLNSLW